MMIVGATLGESIVPVLMGVSLHALGAQSITVIVFLSSIMLVCIYVLIHYRSTAIVRNFRGQECDDNNNDDNGNTNNDNVLHSMEMTEFSEHSKHPMLKHYDNPMHGDLDEEELVTVDFHS